ncbi:hypothetical protein KA005_06210 [bacterium]|nr:hypothetical protein [bacterium]
MAKGKMQIKLETKYSIDHNLNEIHIASFGLSGEELHRKVMRLEDQAVRDALIRLGWTPPKKEKENASTSTR